MIFISQIGKLSHGGASDLPRVTHLVKWIETQAAGLWSLARSFTTFFLGKTFLHLGQVRPEGFVCESRRQMLRGPQGPRLTLSQTEILAQPRAQLTAGTG